jgi:hypothetical protein
LAGGIDIFIPFFLSQELIDVAIYPSHPSVVTMCPPSAAGGLRYYSTINTFLFSFFLSAQLTVPLDEITLTLVGMSYIKRLPKSSSY